MSGDKIATPIIDKNGKPTTVHRSAVVASAQRAGTLPMPSITRDVPEDVAYSALRDEWWAFSKSKRRWSKTEKDVKVRVDSLFVFSDNPTVPTNVEIPPAMVDFNRLRAYFSGMHFAKEMLTDDERKMLVLAEVVISKLDSDSPRGFVN